MRILRGQIGQNDKTNLCRQLGYIDIINLLGDIRQNDKSTPCRQLGYFDLSTLRGQIGENENLHYLVNYDIFM